MSKRDVTQVKISLLRLVDGHTLFLFCSHLPHTSILSIQAIFRCDSISRTGSVTQSVTQSLSQSLIQNLVLSQIYRQQISGSRQQTADSRQQIADSR